MKSAIEVNVFMTVRYSLVDAMTRTFSWPHGFLLPVLALGLLSACAPDLGPMPQPKAEASLASQKSFTAPATDWPVQDWWTAYKNPQLPALIAEGLAGSPDIGIAEARVKEADAAARQSGAALYPHLTANGSASEARQNLHQGFPHTLSYLLP